jgi:ribosomal protein S18 acetylase RimI-like enzyme
MIEIRECDFDNENDCKALVMLMNHYMTGAMGGNLPAYSTYQAVKMIDGLRKHPSKLILLAIAESKYVGLVNSFINFGTFAARPFINIHDIVVIDSYQGQGIGRRMLQTVIERAEEMDCSKITLEVRDDNIIAQSLYSNHGFEEDSPVMHFWTKHLG